MVRERLRPSPGPSNAGRESEGRSTSHLAQAVKTPLRPNLSSCGELEGVRRVEALRFLMALNPVRHSRDVLSFVLLVVKTGAMAFLQFLFAGDAD